MRFRAQQSKEQRRKERERERERESQREKNFRNNSAKTTKFSSLMCIYQTEIFCDEIWRKKFKFFFENL